MAAVDTKNLFGEDTDSSEESVDAAAATAAKPDKGGDAAGEGAKEKESTEQHGDAKVGAQEEVAKEANGGTPGKKNADLFGEETSSSEDDEFDGNDGIVGRAGGDKSKAPPVGKSMNEKLGLDSDSENEGGVTGGSAKPEAKEEAAPPPKQRDPPRLLELLDLNPDSKEDTDVTGGPAKSTVEYHITKLPNLVGLVGDKPYDAKTYDAAKEEEEYRGYVHNMIRWRYKLDADGKKLRDADGKLVRESNTRLVKWSDGSYTLHVGQGQALEVETLDSSYPDDHPDATLAGFAGINGYLYTSKEGQMRPLKEGTARDPPEGGAAAKEKDDGDAPPPVRQILQCLGPIASRLAPRPASLAGDAHRNLALAVRQRSQKRARIAEVVTEVDPEKEKQARIKNNEDLNRNKNRRGGARRSGGGGRRRGMSAAYLEDEEEGAYDGVDLGRMKRRTLGRDRYDDEDDTEMEDYGDDGSGEEEDEWTKKKGRKRGAAAARASSRSKEEEDDSSEEGEVVFGDDDDDDDEEDVHVGKKRGGGTKKAVLEDDDDD